MTAKVSAAPGESMSAPVTLGRELTVQVVAGRVVAVVVVVVEVVVVSRTNIMQN